MKLYVDFDGTLFDTDKYINDIMTIFNEYGINDKIFNETKNILFNEHELFNLDKIINYFIQSYNIDVELKTKIDNLLNKSYLYSEVINCLDILINSGYDLYLFTYGDYNFQSMKIEASGISKYFKDIIITDKDKSQLNLDYKNIIFIDNNPYVIKNLSYTSTKNIIRIKRNSDRYNSFDCFSQKVVECKDFNQVILYLKGGF